MQTHDIIASILPAHILAGALALVFGYVALAAAKGAALHRRSGLLFVGAMVVMSLSGAFIATLNASQVSIVAGLLTFYFVTTSLLTVRPRGQHSHRLDAIAMLFAVPVTLLAFGSGFELTSRGRPEASPMFVFGIVGALATAGDIRMMRARGLKGPRRIARHLWRMCFAMWVAAASFFWGPPGRVPDIINIPPLLAVAVLAPVAVMFYWLRRVRVRQSVAGTARVAAREAAYISQVMQ
jgi:uncharacterized membrane protein